MKKRNRKAALILAAVFLLSGCSNSRDDVITSGFIAMDTYISLTVYGEKGESAAGKVKEEVLRLEGLLSVTDEGSEIWRINHDNGSGVRVSDDTAQIINKALEIGEESGGALDITLYPLVSEWGFTVGEYKVPSRDTLDKLLERVDYRLVEIVDNIVTVPEGFQIDLGAAAKGYAGDRAAQILKEQGISSAIVSLGGNVQALGTKPDGSDWRVGIQNPFGEGNIGILKVSDKAVVTSGSYERYFEEDGKRYWHIIDPSDGYPADKGVVSVTVIGGSGLYCDTLSTALFVMGPDKAREYWKEHKDFDMILINGDGNVFVSEGIYDSFSPSDGVKVQLIKS